jgi:hypothetical protein
LKGGETQLLVDLAGHKGNTLAAGAVSDLRPTGWPPSSHRGVNVPDPAERFKKLGAHEVAPKTSEAVASGAAKARVGVSIAPKQSSGQGQTRPQ